MNLQISERPEDSAGAFRKRDEGAVPGATILLVEDEAFVREVTCEVLRSAGYRVLAARDAAEAERVFNTCTEGVDFLLTDIILPGVTGGILAERLRRGNPALKVLLVSGYGEQIAKLEANGEEYLGKPFSSEVLLRRVRQVLDRGTVIAESEAISMRADGVA